MRTTLITLAMASGALGSLVGRQDTGTFAPGDYGACDPSCLPPANALDTCDPPLPSCVCTTDISAGLKACLGCAISTPDSGTLVTDAQALIAIFNAYCADSGTSIDPNAPNTGTNTATGSTTSTTATGTGTTRPPAATGGRTTTGGTTTTPRSTGTTTTSASATTTTNAAVSGKGALGVLALVAPLVVAGVVL